MKKIFLLLIVFCSSTTLFAQKKVSEKQAHALFQRKAYVKAAAAYEQLEQSQKVLQNLGDCYYYNFQMDNAIRAYGQLFVTYKDSVKKEVYFRYANALKGVKDFGKGDVVMSEYLGFDQNTAKFMKHSTRNTPKSFKLEPLSNNKTNNGDFGIAFYGEKVTFASSRNAAEKAYGWNDKPYLDLFMATVNDKGQLVKVESFPDVINTNKHESNATFSADGKTMYFNRSGDKQVEIGNERVATVKIFKAENVDGIWTNVKMCAFSSDVYSVQHPFLTKDGKKLYFASDMKGTIGSMDIFVVDVFQDGSFSEPRNLGKTINTIHREQFPFVAEDGTLYFASDGHQGNGNLDIFMSYKLTETEFDKPLNLGSTINSEMDDFNFILDEAHDKGYFASNRTGDDNLFAFIREENKLQYFVEGEIRNVNSLELLAAVTVKLYNDKNELLEEVLVGKDGGFVFNIEPNKKYKIMAFKDLYIPAEAEFDTNQKGTINIDLQMKVESYSDAEAIINKKEDKTALIELENIYFDLDKWNIKPQAAQVLDVLVGLLKKYPYMEIQIGSHTDTRASEMYNLRLSNRRAASTLEYLVQNGISRNRLTSVGYGETKPLVVCPKNDCTAQEHAANRRCIFMILK